ncbi:MAG: GreA/GreB family elongation factor [Elusimicrobiales bacterium]|nr:GreA/GreB family elongation factor [Elusimicrobiales bacterium]
MSRAFVKEDGNDAGEPVKRQASGRPNYVTPAGLEALKARAAELGWRRAELVSRQRLDEPRSLELRQAEADLQYYEERVKQAILVDNRGLAAPEVRFGAAVSVREPDGAVKDYRLVGEDEADPKTGKINWSSPLAAALMGAAAGARVALARKGGSVQLEIVAVSYPKD